DAGFVRKGVGTNHRLVRLHGVAGDAGNEPGSRHDLRGIDAGLEVENVATRLYRHDDLLEAGIAGALAEASDRALDLACAVHDSSERVGNRHAEVVVTASGPHHPVGVRYALDQLAQALAPQCGQRVAGGVGHVDRRGAGLDHGIEHAHEKIHVRTYGVLG